MYLYLTADQAAKLLKMGENWGTWSAEYEKTRTFYKSVGFEPLITLTEMWDEEIPCLIMLKVLA